MPDRVEEIERFDFKAANVRARWRVIYGIGILFIYLIVAANVARAAIPALIFGAPALWLFRMRYLVPARDRTKLIEERHKRSTVATALYKEMCGGLRGEELSAAKRTFYKSEIYAALLDVDKRLPKKLVKQLRADHVSETRWKWLTFEILKAGEGENLDSETVRGLKREREQAEKTIGSKRIAKLWAEFASDYPELESE